ncbi:hypothetical protein [Amantichitinum ursilacus]|uniref:Uncharacterized protein n=1 Tax=Amantichitinum ursilacus TaxID=857265 RepID=A0A0N0XGQ8_9NEIS|nr:hypothetical protein [Amantichitinum ursilacus]KPC50295.1 hypothetical protein WG78_18030 [Amantichitinum ursilacus]
MRVLLLSEIQQAVDAFARHEIGLASLTQRLGELHRALLHDGVEWGLNFEEILLDLDSICELAAVNGAAELDAEEQCEVAAHLNAIVSQARALLEVARSVQAGGE